MIDLNPVLTVPWLIAFCLLFFVKNKRAVVGSILSVSLLYFAWAASQEYRARQATNKLAIQKGHLPERVRVLPSLGNSFWFRAIYLYQGEIYAQGILVSPLGPIKIEPGSQVKHLRPEEVLTTSLESKRQVEIWNWFTDGWMFSLDAEKKTIGDGRYTTQATGFETLWALHLNFETPQLTQKKMPSSQKISEQRNIFEGFQKLSDSRGLLPLTSEKN